MLKNNDFSSSHDVKIESSKKSSLTFLLVAAFFLVLLYFFFKFGNILATFLVAIIAAFSLFLSYCYVPRKKPGRKLVGIGITTIVLIPLARNGIVVPLLKKFQIKFQEFFPDYIDYYILLIDVFQSISSSFWESVFINVLQLGVGFGFIHYGVKAMNGGDTYNHTYNVHTDDFKKHVTYE